MYNFTPQVVWYAALAATILVVLLMGGVVERCTAVMLVIANVASLALEGDRHWRHIKIGVVAVDVILTLALVVVALRSDRWWPLPAAAFQFLATMVLLAPLIYPASRPYVYFADVDAWDYLTLTAISVGTLLECKQRSER